MNKLSILRTKFSLSILVLTFSTAALAQSKVSISDAQKMPLGAEVVIEGTVTVASGTFRSSFDDYGFQIEDKTGGMYIAIKDDLKLVVGQNVHLTGRRNQTPLKFPIIEADAVSVRLLPDVSRPKPLRLATGKITDLTVGRLIKITGTVTKPVEEVAPYGYRVSIDDGSGEIIAYVSTSTRISPKQFVRGQKLELTGVAGQFNSQYQIYPRSTADLKQK
jgi:DNA/RNA endonuclease YhcR with UshA esterase domain